MNGDSWVRISQMRVEVCGGLGAREAGLASLDVRVD